MSVHHENGVGPLTRLVVLDSGDATLTPLPIWERAHDRPVVGRTNAVTAAALTAAVLMESTTSAAAAASAEHESAP
ncbi:hypothetical protein [Streptomyces sp. KR80]|uniref:hypothetical protein n=1 Tax=Streptomyces sp. KR80 TaxID=3457426 RepID=UPI003FD0D1BB